MEGQRSIILHYMLQVFYNQPETLNEEDTRNDLPHYDDSPAFNGWLDEQYPLDESKLIYSQALYQTAPEEYRIQLENWQDTEGN